MFSDAGLKDAYAQPTYTKTSDQSGTAVTKEATLRVGATQIAGLIAARVSSFVSGIGGPNTPTVQGGSLYTYETGLSASADQPNIGVWGSLSYVRFNDTTTATNFDADLTTGLLGTDFWATRNLLLGATVVYDRTVVNTTFNEGSQTIDSVTIAPYGAYWLDDMFSFDFAGGYNWADKDSKRILPGTTTEVTGDTRATRWFLVANANVMYVLDRLKLNGTVGYLYAREVTDNFTESNGNFVNGSVTPLGQIRVGGRIGYGLREVLANGVVEPYLRARYDNDRISQNIDVGVGQTEHPNDNDEWTIGGGIDFFAGPVVSGNLEALGSVGRENFDSFSISGTLRIQF